MTPYQNRLCPITQRLADDMLIRNLAQATIECTSNLKHRTFLTTLYASGMRFSEAAHLTLADIDSHRMMLRIACGKGRKDRHVPLSPRHLEMLREYWREYKPTHYLFPGKTPTTPYAADDPEPWVESAKEPEEEVPEAEQMWLPGLAPSFD